MKIQRMLYRALDGSSFSKREVHQSSMVHGQGITKRNIRRSNDIGVGSEVDLRVSEGEDNGERWSERWRRKERDGEGRREMEKDEER